MPDKPLNTDPTYNTDEAAVYVHEHPRSLVNKRCKGEGPDYLKQGRLIRYRRSALDAYLKRCEVNLRN